MQEVKAKRLANMQAGQLARAPASLYYWLLLLATTTTTTTTTTRYFLGTKLATRSYY